MTNAMLCDAVGIDFLNDVLLEIERQNLSRSQLAKLLGFSEKRTAKIFSNPSSMTVNTMLRLASALNVGISFVLHSSLEPVNPQVLTECWEAMGRPLVPCEIRSPEQSEIERKSS